MLPRLLYCIELKFNIRYFIKAARLSSNGYWHIIFQVLRTLPAIATLYNVNLVNNVLFLKENKYPVLSSSSQVSSTKYSFYVSHCAFITSLSLDDNLEFVFLWHTTNIARSYFIQIQIGSQKSVWHEIHSNVNNWNIGLIRWRSVWIQNTALGWYLTEIIKRVI